MPDDDGNITQEDINKTHAKLESSVELFTSQVTAQADKAKTERVNGIVALAIKAGKEATYTAEALSAMEDSTLEIVENSLNDLISVMDDVVPDNDGGVVNQRDDNEPNQVSNYDLIDGLADYISLGLGLDICTEEEKQEVRIEHIAAGLKY